MKKYLLNLKSFLIGAGHIKEAKEIQSLIKSAAPIIDIIDLSTDDEPIRKNVMMEGKYKIEDWYGSLSALGTNVILIPFNEEKVTSNKKALQGFTEIFGLDPDFHRRYKDIQLGANYFGVTSAISNDIGSLNKLKENFPKLWQEISRKLSELGLPENEVVYILYNKDIRELKYEGELPQEKTPKYLGHDIGHTEIDNWAREQTTFKNIIFRFLLEIFQFYKLDSVPDKEELAKFKRTDYINLQDVVADKGSSTTIQYICYDLVDNFFDSKKFFSEKGDNFYDVYSDALSGEVNYKRPDFILFEDRLFKLDSSKLGSITRIENKMLNDLMSHVEDKETGPLHTVKGKVILYDL